MRVASARTENGSSSVNCFRNCKDRQRAEERIRKVASERVSVTVCLCELESVCELERVCVYELERERKMKIHCKCKFLQK